MKSARNNLTRKYLKPYMLAMAATLISAIALNVTAVQAAEKADKKVEKVEKSKKAETVTANKAGIHDDYFYLFEKETKKGGAFLVLEPEGKYRAVWNNIPSTFLTGKGWEKGGRKNVGYKMEFKPGDTGDAWFGLYGHTESPAVEYYVIESWSGERPLAKNKDWLKGSFQSDNGSYDIYQVPKKMSGSGLDVFWSVRKEKAGEKGNINTGNHFDAWAKQKMILGKTFGFMILATGAHKSSGYANVRVFDGDSENGGEPCEVCIWHGKQMPVCERDTDKAWGWENNASCVARGACKDKTGKIHLKNLCGKKNMSEAQLKMLKEAKAAGKCHCEWKNTNYTICADLEKGWGRETSGVCMGEQTCSELTAGTGMVCN